VYNGKVSANLHATFHIRDVVLHYDNPLTTDKILRKYATTLWQKTKQVNTSICHLEKFLGLFGIFRFALQINIGNDERNTTSTFKKTYRK